MQNERSGWRERCADGAEEEGGGRRAEENRRRRRTDGGGGGEEGVPVKLAGPGSAARRRSGWWVVVSGGLVGSVRNLGNEQRAGAEAGIRRQLRASVAADRRRHFHCLRH